MSAQLKSQATLLSLQNTGLICTRKIYSEEKVESVFMFSHKINNTAYIIVKFFYMSCIIVTLHLPVHCVTNNAFIRLYQRSFKMHDVHVLR